MIYLRYASVIFLRNALWYNWDNYDMWYFLNIPCDIFEIYIFVIFLRNALWYICYIPPMIYLKMIMICLRYALWYIQKWCVICLRYAVWYVSWIFYDTAVSRVRNSMKYLFFYHSLTRGKKLCKGLNFWDMYMDYNDKPASPLSAGRGIGVVRSTITDKVTNSKHQGCLL